MRGEGELLNGQKQGTPDGAEGNPVIAYLRELSSAKTTPTASDLALIRRYQKYLEREQKSDEQLLPLHATLAQEFKGLSRSSDSKQARAYLAYQLQREIDQHGRISQYNTLQRARSVLGDELFDQSFSSYELDYYLAHEKFTEFENVLAHVTEKKTLPPEEIRFYEEQLSIGKEVAAEFRSSDTSSKPAESSGQETQTITENSLEVSAYPNPFNPTTKLSIPLSERSDVSVELYSVLGQRVMSYQRTGLSSGTHAVSVNGAQLTSGIYIARVRVESHSGVQTRDVRLTLIK